MLLQSECENVCVAHQMFCERWIICEIREIKLKTCENSVLQKFSCANETHCIVAIQ